jgi:carbohydrate kinase (thermoresistant glucokinase family)
MPHVPGLRSPYNKVGRLVYFGRMLDKIRLHARGALPVGEYGANLGKGFDGRCCAFLGINYADLVTRTLAGGTDADILAWCEQKAVRRSDEECEVWNGFMMKRGWRDSGAEVLAKRIRESGLEGKPVSTMFDYLDFDEGRDPVAIRAWELREPAVILLMGVAGSGKTTVGLKLAAALGWGFRDADDFHPAANVAKMSAGIPLDDDDRAPWLAAIRTHIENCLGRGESAVVTCSALKERYRQTVVTDPRVKLVHLDGNFDLLLARLNQRQAHFMKPEMLRSQFETLERPKNALVLDVAEPPETLVTKIRQAFGV